AGHGAGTADWQDAAGMSMLNDAYAYGGGLVTDKKRIADNESVAEMLGLIQGASAIEGLWQAFPILQQAFPRLSDFSEKLVELKEQSKILLLPDRFNE